MHIHIHRGQNQIGGSVIEISTNTSKLIFDAGTELDETEQINIPQIEGLFVGQKNYDAVFVSHYHSDHTGLLNYLVNDIPVYMGEKAFNILKSAYEYRKINLTFTPGYIYHKQTIKIGDISVTPILCDHSAFDSYMFIIEAENKRILYTGDFRANGRADFNILINELPEVDAVIIEGTTLTRDNNIQNIEEKKLEDIAVNFLKNHNGPTFVMMSPMNVDRLKTVENISKRTNRILLEDLYTAKIAAVSDCAVPDRNKNIRVFMTKGNSEYDELCKYGDAKISREKISEEKFIMCIRSSMKSYLEKLNKLLSFKDGVLFYGMWKGYMEQPQLKDFIKFMKNKGVKLHILHTSGHADSMTIDKLIKKVKPKFILPVHTENAEWFNRYNKNILISNEAKINL